MKIKFLKNLDRLLKQGNIKWRNFKISLALDLLRVVGIKM